MENSAGERKFVGAVVYELLGTAFIMYAMIVSKGVYGEACIYLTFAMMLCAWNVSGGHFNPCFSVATLIGNFSGKNIFLCVLMIVGQFLGGFLGVLLGYLAVIDSDFMKPISKYEKGYGKVPTDWINII